MGTSGNEAFMQFPNNYVPPVSSDREETIRRLGRHNTHIAPQFTEVKTPVVRGGLVASAILSTPQPRASIVSQFSIDVITAVEEKSPPRSSSERRGVGKSRRAIRVSSPYIL